MQALRRLEQQAVKILIEQTEFFLFSSTKILGIGNCISIVYDSGKKSHFHSHFQQNLAGLAYSFYLWESNFSMAHNINGNRNREPGNSYFGTMEPDKEFSG